MLLFLKKHPLRPTYVEKRIQVKAQRAPMTQKLRSKPPSWRKTGPLYHKKSPTRIVQGFSLFVDAEGFEPPTLCL